MNRCIRILSNQLFSLGVSCVLINLLLTPKYILLESDCPVNCILADLSWLVRRNVVCSNGQLSQLWNSYVILVTDLYKIWISRSRDYHRRNISSHEEVEVIILLLLQFFIKLSSSWKYKVQENFALRFLFFRLSVKFFLFRESNYSFQPKLSDVISLKNMSILYCLFVCWVLWHINLCRLFNAKSILMSIICSI